METKRKVVRTWKQLVADPRVKGSEIWTEDNDGKDYWIPLSKGFEYEGCTCIHEWSQRACINALNNVRKV